MAAPGVSLGSSLVVHQGGGGLGGLNGQHGAGLLGRGCSRSSFVLVGMALSAVSSVPSPSVWGLLTSTLASRASYLRDSLVISKALGVSALVWPVSRPDSLMQRLDSLLYAESDAWSKQAELLVLV